MNMNAKKRVNGSWVDAPYYIHKTAADTFTTLPVDVYADGNNATVGLKGNTDQSGTPSSGNPIMPQGTGDRTGNLFDKNDCTVAGYIKNDGTISITADNWFTTKNYIKCSGIITMNALNGLGTAAHIACYDEQKNLLGACRITENNQKQNTINLIDGTKYIKACSRDNNLDSLMLNEGSTALPYEPYGYKIPISSANTTTPVYLGEVETTRKIYKLVLTGQEVWYDDALPKGDTFSYRMTAPYIYDVGNTVGYDAICSHFQVGAYYAASIVGTQHSSRNLYFRNTETTLENWKQWLADQYSNGTPVIVWYRLATPTTGVVNEPLMKIGNYADEVSNISIPTITGKNIVDVETVLKPSEVSFNYAGWHTAVVHKRINGAWD